jgi:hypothetical protein
MMIAEPGDQTIDNQGLAVLSFLCQFAKFRNKAGEEIQLFGCQTYGQRPFSGCISSGSITIFDRTAEGQNCRGSYIEAAFAERGVDISAGEAYIARVFLSPGKCILTAAIVKQGQFELA